MEEARMRHVLMSLCLALGSGLLACGDDNDDDDKPGDAGTGDGGAKDAGAQDSGASDSGADTGSPEGGSASVGGRDGAVKPDAGPPAQACTDLGPCCESLTTNSQYLVCKGAITDNDGNTCRLVHEQFC